MNRRHHRIIPSQRDQHVANGNTVEVLKGLAPGDRVITGGGLFIDRVAAGG